MSIESALQSFRTGSPLIIFDSEKRESESDIFVSGEHCRGTDVRTLRTLGGGIIYMTVPPDAGHALGLVHLDDLFRHSMTYAPVLSELCRGEESVEHRSAFSFSLNHRSGFTGVTDDERAYTVVRFAELVREIGSQRAADEGEPWTCAARMRRFGDEFRSPGHVQVCLAAPGLVTRRRGHTELSTAFSLLAGLSGVCLGCELLHESGRSQSRSEAAHLAAQLRIPFLDGRAIVDRWTSTQQDCKLPPARVSGPPR